jgi:hypothetical protein
VAARGFAWSFDAGQTKVANTMRLTDRGEWHEITEVAVCSGPPRKTLDMTLKRVP